MSKYAGVARIIRPHGLNGAMLVELLDYAYIYNVSLQNLANEKLFLIDEDEASEIQIEKIFGIVKNRCRIKFSGFDGIDQIQHLRAKTLAVQKNDDDFVIDELIGSKVWWNNQQVTILGIYNFGAGLVADTDCEDMIRLEDLFPKKKNNMLR